MGGVIGVSAGGANCAGIAREANGGGSLKEPASGFGGGCSECDEVEAVVDDDDESAGGGSGADERPDTLAAPIRVGGGPLRPEVDIGGGIPPTPPEAPPLTLVNISNNQVGVGNERNEPLSATRTGADLSTVSAFFNFVPF